MSSSPSHLVIFDFDWSLINENSDTWVIHQLDPSGAIWQQLLERLKGGEGWTQLMDWSAGQLHDAGHSLNDLEQALRKVPALKNVLAAVELAREHGAELRILSDANELYIQWILEALGLGGDAFSVTVTNFASATDEGNGGGRLSIAPHQPEGAPHGCPLCPSNLCKGGVLDAWLRDWACAAPPRCAYVGDGTGDFCPATRLSEADTVFARKAPHDGLLKKCASAPGTVRAKLVEWGDAEEGAELLDGFRDFFTAER
jgi:pyridoxal phosphate phosphatase PHOSPHO2